MFVNRLPKLVQCLIDLHPGLANRLLGCVDRIGQQVAALLDASGICAVVEFDSLRLEEVTEVLEEFVFFDCFHNSLTKLLEE